MDSKKEKDRLSDIILGRVGLMGNFLSDPVSTSPEPPVDTPDRERRSRAAEMTSPEEYKRRFPLPSPRSGRPCTLTGGCTAVSPCWSGPPVAAASRVSSSGCWSFIWRSTGRISPGCSVRSTGPGMTRMGQTYADLLQYRPIFEERRWGEYKVVNTAEFSNGYKSITKQLKIKSDKSISYQLHRHRNEVWTFIDGEGVLVLDDIRSVVSRGDTVTIKKGVKHVIIAELYKIIKGYIIMCPFIILEIV